MILSCVKLEKSYGERTLFREASFSLEKGEILGLVGANGVGKTTLFNIIIGLEQPDSGSVVLQNGAKVGYLSQHVCANSDKTTYEETLTIFDHLKAMEVRLKELETLLHTDHSEELINEQAMLIEKYESLGGLTYVSMTHAVLAGLGFSEEEQNLPVSALSGGQKSKVGLAKLLLEKPDIMLLDEPTNHLDIASVSWLEKFIVGSKLTALVISHDRYFLDKICTKVAEIYTGKIFVTDGNYTRHMQLREELEYAAERNYANTMAEVKRIEGIIEQQRRWNREKNIKTAESKQKQIDRMLDGLEKPEHERNDFSFNFSPYSESGEDVLKITDLTMQFPGKTLYENVSFEVKKGDSVFIVGENGVGKTTLIKQIMKKGRGVLFGVGVVIGYFDQHQLGLTLSKTIMDEVHDAYPGMGDTEVRSALARFGFKNDKVFDEISVLSGGERAKVSLCKLMLKRCNLLILDEPTNHLDIYSMAALEEALKSYTGTLLVISHDRYFINKLASKVVELKSSGVKVVIGNYDDYVNEMETEDVVAKTTVVKEVGAGGKSYMEQKKRRSELTKLKTAVCNAEKDIERYESDISAIHAELENPEIATDYEKISELTTLLAEKDELLAETYAKWEELSLQLEEE